MHELYAVKIYFNKGKFHLLVQSYLFSHQEINADILHGAA